MSAKYWAISDVHGCFDQFKKLVAKLKLQKGDRVYVLGDFIDRGPDVKGLLDYVHRRNDTFTCLQGNHEDMLLNLCDSPSFKRELHWETKCGGDATLKSFGVTSVRNIPPNYIRQIRNMLLHVQVNGFVLSHAGVNLNHHSPFRNTDTNREHILWNRSVEPNPKSELSIVCGHTPTELEQIKASTETQKVMIDGGCAYGMNLVAFCLQDRSIEYVPSNL